MKPEEDPPRAATRDGPFPIVGIGASAGGIEAFKSLLGALPDDTGMAFVFVLHLAPTHVSMLAQILARETRMPVKEVHDAPQVQPNRVYVIPAGKAMIIRKGALHLIPESDIPHHPVDTFFSALAEDRGHLAIGVVLSGTATDGTLGLAAIKAVGGITFAQDASAQHDGMPCSAISSGCVDFVLAPQEIASELVRLAHHPYVTEASDEAGEPDGVKQILDLVRHHSGVDFTQYKSNTLHRRIRRRMALHKVAEFREYAAYLKRHAEEAEALYQDILISVTNFFRNAEAFESLKTQVFPRLFKNRSRQDPVRVWVLGCSSGEEAYSLAIVLAEYIAETQSPVPVSLYATDLNNASIERCRAGRYPRSIADDVSAERLRRFFVELGGGYRVTKSIRDMCIFARQNVLTDLPFSRMDLVSCRNVMIYMEAGLQRKLLQTLHYALKPRGFLFLGASETIGANRELFEPEDVKHKIFAKKAAAPRAEQAFPVAPYTPLVQERSTERWGEAPKDLHAELQREADRVLLTRYVPAGVLLNSEFEVLQFRGDTGLYLTPAPGKASLNVLKMAREGLLVSLRALLQKAKKLDTAVQERDVRIRSNGGFRRVALKVIPIKRSGSQARWYWVLFENGERMVRGEEPERGATRTVSRGKTRNKLLQDRDDQIMRLTQELGATREYLQSVIEQQEAANEELQSANEEVQSVNEELQSINEELETSKEEVQSSNEELRTVNEELHNRNEQLSRLNEDLNNLLGSVEIAIVMVWQDLRIRRFTPLAEKHFNLIATDIGRPIGDIKLNLELPNLPQLLRQAIDGASIREIEVQDGRGRWYLLRIRPYRTLENRIDGAVVALFDIQALKLNQEILERQSKLLEQTHEAIFAREMDGEILYWSRGAELLYGYTAKEAVGRSKFELLATDESQRKLLQDSLEGAGQWEGELTHRTKAGRTLVIDSTQVVVREGGRKLVLETNHDVTERKHLAEALHRQVEELALADRHKNEFLAMLAHELRNPLAPLRNAVHILKRPGATHEMASQARDLIERQVTHMTRLVDDLLDAARINRGQVQLQMQPTELQTVLKRAVETTHYLIDERRQRLSIELANTPITLDADPARLEQVFSNLLSNAAKYTPEAGDIRLSAELAKPDGVEGDSPARAIVRIRDSGIGIEPGMLSRVFDLFTQADRSLERSRGGLGIGLSVVRSLVELHGGKVAVHSDGNERGSEFTVELPVAPNQKSGEGPEVGTRTGPAPDGRAAPSRASASRDGSGTCGAVRVLVVDDNADIAESTALILQLAGYTVKKALSGEEAIEMAAAFEPSVVLLDIGMPGLDGYAVARRLRDEPNLKKAVLIAVTGYGTSADRSRAKAAGFDRHLVKPVDPAALQHLLTDLSVAPHRGEPAGSS
ncbi:MAG TPA: chemotaxis protein CheB [Steroidobacteraceae bacterium]|nr:chemotaxis protein CheB [Steroidobacteraceae bacterium]